MRLGINASNLRAGGGVTHLSELLRAAEPQEQGITKVVVWAGENTLKHIPTKPWLESVHVQMLDRSLPIRLYWQKVKLPELAKHSCDLLFIPGGGSGGNYKPFVTMSRNMLPFERDEMRRYKGSWIGMRLRLLRLSQIKSFSNAEGLIFLTEYARSVISKHENTFKGRSTIIPHGINKRFFMCPRRQKPISSYSNNEPFRFLYVSIIDIYKHQWHVAEAISKLRQMGLPVALDLVGGAYGPALRRLQDVIAHIDPEGAYIRYLGPVPYSQLQEFYHQADAFVFSSSCENMPNILLEAMASGLPTACSNRGPMPEMLGAAGVYFDPENPREIAMALHQLIASSDLRASYAVAAYQRAQQYSWERCAKETFSFLSEVAKSSTKKKSDN